MSTSIPLRRLFHTSGGIKLLVIREKTRHKEEDEEDEVGTKTAVPSPLRALEFASAHQAVSYSSGCNKKKATGRRP